MVKFECLSSVLVSASFGMLHFFTLSEGTLQEDHCQAVFTGAWVCVCMRECVCVGVLIYMGCCLLLMKLLENPRVCVQVQVFQNIRSHLVTLKSEVILSGKGS